MGSLTDPMKIVSMPALIIALLFLGAQFAPAAHTLFEEGHGPHSCCTDGQTAPHIDKCPVDHDAPPCPVCASARGVSAVTVPIQNAARAASPERLQAVPRDILVDPILFISPDTRGPPA